MPIESFLKQSTTLVTRTSKLTGVTRTMELPISPDELAQIENRYNTGQLIQRIVPDLPLDTREFLMTGITKEEWDAHFAGRED